MTSDYLLEGASDDAAEAKLVDRAASGSRSPTDEDKHVAKTLLDAFLTKRQQLQTWVRYPGRKMEDRR